MCLGILCMFVFVMCHVSGYLCVTVFVCDVCHVSGYLCVCLHGNQKELCHVLILSECVHPVVSVQLARC